MSRIHEALKKAEQERAGVQVTEPDAIAPEAVAGGDKPGVFDDECGCSRYSRGAAFGSASRLPNVGRVSPIRRPASAVLTSGVASRLQCECFFQSRPQPSRCGAVSHPPLAALSNSCESAASDCTCNELGAGRRQNFYYGQFGTGHCPPA